MGHGGNIYKIERDLGIPREALIDYSANINPLGVPALLKNNIIKEIDSLVNYPDPDYKDLKSAIADFYQVCEEDILLGNGAAEIIHSCIRRIQPKKAVILQPSFSEYEAALAIVGTELKELYLREENEFRIEVEEIIREIDDTIDLVILCNPNNPTSTLIARDDLIKILSHCSDNNTFVLIDEAFMDFIDEEGSISLIGDYDKYKNLIIVRAFTKFFGIPGLRLGFGVTSNKSLLKKLKESGLPWNLNTFAGGFGIMLKANNDYITETYKWMREEPLRFATELKSIKKLRVFHPRANFILIKILEDNLNTGILKNRLLEYRILIRECCNFKGLNNKFFRIAIKDNNTNMYFLKALKECLYD